MARRNFTDVQRRAYADCARSKPNGVSIAASHAGVKEDTIKDWIRQFYGSAGSKQNVPLPPPPNDPSSPRLPRLGPPPASGTTVLSATEEATNARAKRKRKWFGRKRRRRKDADKLRAIISEWQKDYKQAARPWAVTVGRPDRPQTPDGTERIVERPPEGCNVYILDTGLLSALARNDDDAWECLERLVGELNAVVVPAGAIGPAFTNALPHKLLERAFASSCIRQVPLDYFEARAAGMLCSATSTSDLIDASVVITAKACRQTLNRKRAGKRCAVRIVTQDVNKTMRLLPAAGLRLVGQPASDKWKLLRVALVD